jgi:Mg-chelatase subunit ChlD
VFPCSGNWETSYGNSIAGIYELYNYALANVCLSGPTYFAPLIRFTSQKIATELHGKPNSYNVLLIITDGAINDEQETRDAIVEASELPISIIIIGVGQADFSAMDRLDSDGTVGFC